jgi:hypothetical protein
LIIFRGICVFIQLFPTGAKKSKPGMPGNGEPLRFFQDIRQMQYVMFRFVTGARNSSLGPVFPNPSSYQTWFDSRMSMPSDCSIHSSCWLDRILSINIHKAQMLDRCVAAISCAQSGFPKILPHIGESTGSTFLRADWPIFQRPTDKFGFYSPFNILLLKCPYLLDLRCWAFFLSEEWWNLTCSIKRPSLSLSYPRQVWLRWSHALVRTLLGDAHRDRDQSLKLMLHSEK